ncbi:MAG: PAS domain-containing protein, partial [Planctomycetes bacterium]|nr:PAS domain-containing protein [Planctomycetota bacterium]
MNGATLDVRELSNNEVADMKGQIAAIHKAMAVIEFDLDGTIRTANPNFLGAVGYSLDEIQGQHHRMFVDSTFARSPDYAAFWASLARGEFQAGEYKRFGKGDREIWIHASYNPILDADGKPFKVVKFATDITATKRRNANFEGQLSAIDKAMAVIEFDLDGTIRTANANFLGAVGYGLDQIRGQHHRMFVDPDYAKTPEYAGFWASLARGEFQSGEYKRFGKGGREIWIQATYNPILDADGKPFKVVKFATDITATKLRNADFEGQLSAIDKAMAVIEFDLDGTIRTANPNFLDTLGYRIDEIQGQHHRIFVDPNYAKGSDYAAFWAALGNGEFQAGEYKRFGKGGREIWIQASYNPIFDADGKPFKVVKYATDITENVRQRTIIAETAVRLSRSVEGLSSTSTQMAGNANETTMQANSASAAAEQVSQSVQSVAAGADELQASIREISQSAAHAARVASEAVTAA